MLLVIHFLIKIFHMLLVIIYQLPHIGSKSDRKSLNASTYKIHKIIFIVEIKHAKFNTVQRIKHAHTIVYTTHTTTPTKTHDHFLVQNYRFQVLIHKLFSWINTHKQITKTKLQPIQPIEIQNRNPPYEKDTDRKTEISNT